jgi:3-oxoacyl-[acyl-carrier-protein] synthase III
MEPPVRYAHPPEAVMPRVPPQKLLPRHRQQFRCSPGLTNTMPVPTIQSARARRCTPVGQNARESGLLRVVAHDARQQLTDVLRLRADSLDALSVDPDRLGDGAAACVLASRVASSAAQISGVFHGYSGYGLEPGFSMTTGGSDFTPTPGDIPEFAHDYSSVDERGASLFADGLAAAQRLGIDRSAVDYFIPHQANGRMASLLAARIELDETRIFVNADRIGNTGSAAVWLALAELRARLQAGDTVSVLGAEATKYLFGGFLYVHA